MNKEGKENKFDWRVREEIGILTLNNPPENYLEKPEFIDLGEMKRMIGSSPVKGLLICGTGRHFSAGAKLGNLYSLSTDETALSIQIERGKELLTFIEDLDIPVISAIKGTCFGGGLEIALASHIRICSNNALFAFPETNHGMIPGLGGTVRSLQNTGFSKALQMILSGDIVNAEEALAIGLVDRISDDPVNDAFVLLKKMTTDKPLKVIGSVMKALRNARNLSPADAMREETKLFCELAADDAKRRKNLS